MRSLAIISTLLLTLSVNAKQLYGFGNISVNYLDWTSGTEDRTVGNGPKRDFAYLELEGGGGYDWGTLYGFIDFENPGGNNDGKNSPDAYSSDGARMSAKGVIQKNLAGGFNLYGHLYVFAESSSGFFDQNNVIGFSHDGKITDNFQFSPFLGVHYESSAENGNGYNGVMTGWTILYNFKMGSQNFTISNWNEIELFRESQFRGNQKGPMSLDDYGINGALAIWWNLTGYTLGIQYRYADQKLGSDTYNDGFIYSAKYNF